MAIDYWRLAEEFSPGLRAVRGFREGKWKPKEYTEPLAPTERAYLRAGEIPAQLGSGAREWGEEALGNVREYFDPYAETRRADVARRQDKARKEAIAQAAAEGSLAADAARQAAGGKQPGEKPGVAGYIEAGGQQFEVKSFEEPKTQFSWQAGAQPSPTIIGPSGKYQGPVIAGEAAPATMAERRAQSSALLAPGAFQGGGELRIPSWMEVQGAGYADLPSYWAAQASMAAQREAQGMGLERMRRQEEVESELEPLQRQIAETQLRGEAMLGPMQIEAQRQALEKPGVSGRDIGMRFVQDIEDNAKELSRQAIAEGKAGRTDEANRLQALAESEHRRAQEYAIAITTGVQLKAQDPLSQLMGMPQSAAKP